MAGVVDNFYNVIGSSNSVFKINWGLMTNAFYLIIALVVVSFFMWKFYNSISKRNLINLNLSQYNYSNHPVTSKVSAILLYLLEYIIIMPFLIILWFAGLTVVLWLLAPDSLGVSRVLLVSTGLIGAIRVTAYFRKKLAEDLAKLFPLIAMATFLLSFEVLQNNFSSISSNFGELPLLLENFFSYLLVILSIEVFLRIIYSIYAFRISEEEQDDVTKLTRKN